MIIFQDEDDRYLAFLTDPKNRAGFIINTTRKPSASYLALHRAACHTIQGSPTNGQQWTTGNYCKIWASEAEELQEWATREFQGIPKACGICHPLPDVERAPDSSADTEAEPGPTKIQEELVMQLACEGGGETIFRRPTASGWVYWSDGSTMDFDANDVDYWRSWRRGETSNLGELLPSALPFLSLLNIHSEYRDWMRETYRATLILFHTESQQPPKSMASWRKKLGRVDYPSFHALYSPNTDSKADLYRQLLYMDANSIPALSIIQEILGDCKTAVSEVEAMLFDPNWQAHLVASAAIALGVVSDESITALWQAFDRGSFVSPHLAAVAALVDDDFQTKAKQRLMKNDPFSANGDAKALPALLALSLQNAEGNAWAKEFSKRFDVRLMLGRDRDDGGRIALDWQIGFTAAQSHLQ